MLGSREAALVDIRRKICALLSRPDLRRLRLLPGPWAKAATAALFETVFLRIDTESFDRLWEISRHATLGRHVRKISYDGRTLCGRAAREGFQEWLRCSAGGGLGLDWKARDELISRIEEQELERYHINYLESLFRQEYIQQPHHEKDLLITALKQLPNLSGVEYVVPSGFEQPSSSTVPPLETLSPRARHILAAPEDSYGYLASEAHFWALWQTACLSGHAHRLRTLRGSNLDLRRWNTAAGKSLKDCDKALPGLEHISLEFDLAQHGYGDTTTLAGIIAGASSLKALRVSFDSFSYDDPSAVIHLPQLIYGAIRWDHLRRLSLQAVVTTEKDLESLLARHKETLRSLELSNINFEAVASGIYRHGSWIRFIHFLSETLSLEHVRFNGCFSNRQDEGWVTRDVDDEQRPGSSTVPKPYTTKCLKNASSGLSRTVGIRLLLRGLGRVMMSGLVINCLGSLRKMTLGCLRTACLYKLRLVGDGCSVSIVLYWCCKCARTKTNEACRNFNGLLYKYEILQYAVLELNGSVVY